MSDGFLGRWSRRKIEARIEGKVEADGEAASRAESRRVENVEPSGGEGAAPLEGSAPSAAVADEADSERAETLTEEEIAALPPIESFTLETDLAPFLRRGVPKALKNAAMRKMWLLDPAIRDYRDVALDYAYDWNTPGGVPGNAGSITREATRRMLDAMKPSLPAPNEPPHGEPAAAAGGPDPQSTAALPDASDESAGVIGTEAEAPRPAEAAGSAARPASPPEPEFAVRTWPDGALHDVEEPQEAALRKRRHGKATPV